MPSNVAIRLGRMHRVRATAQTWFRKAAALLPREAEQAGNDEQRWLVGYEAHLLLYEALYEAEALLPLLDEEQIDEIAQRARALADKARTHRLAFKLTQVEGRTPEEAKTFIEGAERLRGGGG